MKKIVHVVSHSHWDREWYMPLINHQFKLVDLFDGIIRASKDEKFIQFQMDGHYLPIEDYLQIKPENREIIYDLIRRGKIIVGPWYILQDSFLTSGESNVRNLEIGIKLSEEIGIPSKIGYFPDTFGNIGQAPQILKKAGIHNAYFGRGVKATGFANVVIEDYVSKNSEMFWQSPDGSKVLGILFANWYCNGVDIPYETNLMKKFLDTKIEDMEKYASTRHLLLMNGCDHSPVQENIGEIIEKANTLYEDYEFIHSNLEYYYDCVNEEANIDSLTVIEGELRSQTTDGWGTLQGTSSARYPLKYKNKTAELMIEEVVQPLYSMLVDKELYPKEKIEYIYKELFSNHPHDSICGCSVDSVHEGNMRRFKTVLEGLDFLKFNAGEFLSENLKHDYDEEHVFTVINTTPYSQRKEATVEIEYDKRYFRGFEYLQLAEELKNIKIKEMKVVDDNKEYDTYIKDLGVLFDYDLPETEFRKGYFARKIEIRFMAELGPFERKIFRLQERPGYIGRANMLNQKSVETNLLNIEIEDNATLTITDKRNNKVYRNVLGLENSGDIGNEYIYKQSGDNLVIKSSKLVDYSIEQLTTKDYLIRMHEIISIPKSAADTLDNEQKMVIPVENRVSERSEEYVDIKVYKKVKIDILKSTIRATLRIDNKAKDHRMRFGIGHNLDTDKIHAESIFEVVPRDKFAPKTWTNPDFAQNFNRFVQMYDENGGFTISTIGMQEYEQVEDDLYLTLYRSVGEMGDWGYFPTPDAQLLEEMRFELYIDFFVSDRVSSWQRALGDRVPLFTKQIHGKQGKINGNDTFNINIGSNLFSTLYRNDNGERILRVFNPDTITHRLKVNGEITDILAREALNDDSYDKTYLNPYEIRTIRLEEE